MPSVEQMLQNLKKEVTDCQDSQTAVFGENFRQFFTDAQRDLSRASNRANDLLHKLHNPPLSLNLSTSTNEQSESFGVPNLLDHNVLRDNSIPSSTVAIAGTSNAVPNSDHDTNPEPDHGFSIPHEERTSSALAAVHADNERLARKEARKRKEEAEDLVLHKDDVRGNSDKTSKKPSVDSGSTVFHTPPNVISPDPRSCLSTPTQRPSTAHQTGSARVTPIRTRLSRNSEDRPITLDVSDVPEEFVSGSVSNVESPHMPKAFDQDVANIAITSLVPKDTSEVIERRPSLSAIEENPTLPTLHNNVDLDAAPTSPNVKGLYESSDVVDAEASDSKNSNPPLPVVISSGHAKRQKFLKLSDSPESMSSPLPKEDFQTVTRSSKTYVLDPNDVSDTNLHHGGVEDGMAIRTRSSAISEDFVGEDQIRVTEPSSSVWKVASMKDDKCSANVLKEQKTFGSSSQKEGDGGVEEKPSRKDLSHVRTEGTGGEHCSGDASQSGNVEIDGIGDNNLSRQADMKVQVPSSGQSDREEKAETVKNTGDVYSNAEKDIIDGALSHSVHDDCSSDLAVSYSKKLRSRKAIVTFRDDHEQISPNSRSDSDENSLVNHASTAQDTSSFQVNRDGKISSSAVNELFKLMMEPTKTCDKKRIAAETHDTQAPTSGLPLQATELPSKSSSRLKPHRKYFSSKQSSFLAHTPGARPPLPESCSTSSRDLLFSYRAVDEDGSKLSMKNVGDINLDVSLNGGSPRSCGDKSDSKPSECEDVPKGVHADLPLINANVAVAQALDTREDGVSVKIRRILAAASQCKSETRRQIESVRAERMASQSSKKSAPQLNLSTGNSNSGFNFRKVSSRVPTQPALLSSEAQCVDATEGHNTPPVDEMELLADHENMDKSDISMKDVLTNSKLSEPRPGATHSHDQIDDPNRATSEYSSEIAKRSVKVEVLDDTEQSETVCPVTGTSTAHNNQLEKTPEEKSEGYGPGPVLMNLVTSVTSFLPNVVDLAGWKNAISKENDEESPEEIAKRQRADVERREAEVQARRDAFRIQKQREIEEKQRRAEMKRQEIAEAERQREEERRRKEELRLRKKKEEEEQRKQKKLEEERKREHRRIQVLLKRKQMEERLEHDRELEAKRVKKENVVMSTTGSSSAIPGTSRNAGCEEGYDAKSFRTPRSKVSKAVSGESSYMMTPATETVIESPDKEERRRQEKHVPRWAKSKNILAAVETQNKEDPDEVFANAPPMCNLSDLFGDRRKYRTRSSSGNWTMDRLTALEKTVYKKATRGFEGKKR